MKKFFIVTAAISFLILGSLCLSACQKLEAAEPHSLSEWMELVTDEELDRLELVSNSSEIDSEGLYLVASVPEENCYLYCYQPGGELFFRFRGKRSLIEEVRLDLWTMPQIVCGDYDGDGEKEAALLWTEAHGTGVSVYKLTVAKELDGELQFFMLEQADYMKQLNERIDWKWEPEQERLSCVLDETQLEESWELKELFDNLVADAVRNESTYEREDAFEGISWEEQAAFHVENGTIWLFLEGGYRLKGVGMTIHEEDTPGLRAEVFWEDGCFHLGNIEIKKGSYEYE